MRARYMANILLSLKSDPQCVLHEWDSRKGIDKIYPLYFSVTQVREGFVVFRIEHDDMLNEYLSEEQVPDVFDNGDPVLNYKKIVDTILENKEMLPTLMGLDENLDKIIAEKLRE